MKKYIKASLCFFFTVLIISTVYSSDKALSSIIAIYGTGGRICGSPFIDLKGRAAVISEDRYLYLFDSRGSLIEKNRLPEKPLDFLSAGDDGTIYAYFSSNSLKALNVKGRVLWSRKEDNPPAVKPLITVHGNIAAADTSGNISSYTSRGRLRWKINAGAGISDLSSAGSYGLIFASLDNKTISVIDNSGRVVKSIKSGSPAAGISSSPAEGIIYISEKNGNIHAYTEELDFIKTMTIDSNIASIHQDGKNLLVITEKGGLKSITPEGEILFSRLPGSRFTANPLLFSDSIYLIKSGGYISGITRSGIRDINLPVPADAVRGFRGFEKTGITAGLAATGSLIVFGGQDWVVYFIDSKEELIGPADNHETSGFKPPPMGNFFKYIEELYQAGGAESYDKILSLVEELVLSGIQRGSDEYYALRILEIIGKDSISTNTSGMIRSRAAHLISEIGTRASQNILRQMLENEPDLYNLPVLIRLLGSSGSDPAGDNVRLFNRIIRRYPADRRIAESVLSSLQQISDYHGFIPSGESRSLLIFMLDNAGDTDLKLSLMDALKTISW